jgi:hypothetical protein
MQENFPTEQVSNIRTQNNRNRNNQRTAAEEVSADKFHYEELTPEQVAALHQVVALRGVLPKCHRTDKISW